MTKYKYWWTWRSVVVKIPVLKHGSFPKDSDSNKIRIRVYHTQVCFILFILTPQCVHLQSSKRRLAFRTREVSANKPPNSSSQCLPAQGLFIEHILFRWRWPPRNHKITNGRNSVEWENASSCSPNTYT